MLGAALVCPGLWLLVGSPAEAKTYAYLISSDRTVIKIDADTDTIVSRQTLPHLQMIAPGAWDAFVSGPDNLLLLSYSTFQTKADVNDFRIAAFDLRTLAFKKDLGVVWVERPDILIPPTGPHFFILWFDPAANGGQGGPRATRYDKGTLAPLGDLPQAPGVGRTVFSADGSRLYSFSTELLEPIRTFTSTDLGLVASLDVSPLLSPQGFGARIDDLLGDRALIYQSMTPIGVEPVNPTLLTVRLADGVPSVRIAPGLKGRGYLTLDGTKIVFSEEAFVRDLDGSIREVRSAGRPHVYDVATGAKLGQITVPARDAGDVWAIHPRGDKVYYRSRAEGDEEYTIAVVSLTTFSLVKELKLPSSYIFFVEENS
jgi:hypothetical protein